MITAATNTIFISTATITVSTVVETVSTFTTTVSTSTITSSLLNKLKARELEVEAWGIVLPLVLVSFAALELLSTCSYLSVSAAKTTITVTSSVTTTVSTTLTLLISVTETLSVTTTQTIHNPIGCDNQALYTAVASKVFEEYCNCDWAYNDITNFLSSDLRKSNLFSMSVVFIEWMWLI